MKKFLLTEEEKIRIKSMYGLITENDEVKKRRCYEYNYRSNTPVTANSCDIQSFLKNIGHNITVDCNFGNNTATAFGTWLYGAAAKVDTVDKLWKKLKNKGYDVGDVTGFGPKMAKVVAGRINYYVPTQAQLCRNQKLNLTIYDITDYDCRRKIDPAWRNSLNWWKNKLNEPAFYNKLKKINKWDDNTTSYWISEYKKHLEKDLKGPFCLKKGYDADIESAYAYATWGSIDDGGVITATGCKVAYNRDYSNLSLIDIESTMVHEIQHCLYDVKPMTPHSSWKKVFPKATWGAEGSTVSKSQISYTTNEKHGVYANDIKKWENYLSNNEGEYTCEETENSSRINGLKRLLGYKTAQKITVSDFKKFLKEEDFPYNDSQAFWLCLCWVKNGAPDIEIFLKNLDENVVAKNDENNNDIDKDEVA